MKSLLPVIAVLLCGIFSAACGGGGTANTGPDNPWVGTRTTQYVLRGDDPSDFTGPDGDDPLIQAQLRQALSGRTFNLDLYEIENSSGVNQQIIVHSADVLSSIFSGTAEAFQIPGHITPGDDNAMLELNLAAPVYAWQSLNLRGQFSGTAINNLIILIHPHRAYGVVGPAPVGVEWDITGLNGSRLVSVHCKQVTWLYALSKVVQ